ncbi:Oxidoreductase, molybdopterin-binding domain-containing protein [Xylariaceae sp. AK1471]|nr:Oxidoreductase, molybdopterin-binding domain-containing protein [Xylariaceae sp. AK1471]
MLRTFAEPPTWLGHFPAVFASILGFALKEDKVDDKQSYRFTSIAIMEPIFITEDGYVRNHGSLPTAEQLDSSKRQVQIGGCVKESLKLSIANFQNDYEQHEVVYALQCAGNRRHDIRSNTKDAQGIEWFDGAVMNCRWRGPLLKDIISSTRSASTWPQEIQLRTSPLPRFS